MSWRAHPRPVPVHMTGVTSPASGVSQIWVWMWAKPGQDQDMPPKLDVPTYEELHADLRHLAVVGVGRLRRTPVPALRRVAEALDLADPLSTEPAPVVRLLRDASDRLGGGDTQEQAEYVLGLKEGTELWTAARRQEEAAMLAGIQADSYRKKPQRELLGLLTDKILDLVYEQGLRQSRVAMEQHRHPADSRLAVQWVERFEAYYRIWTPVWALKADCEAALHTYNEKPAEHLPWDSASSAKWDPVEQAREYARDALYDYASYQLELKRFKSRHGGLWLLSDPQVETNVSDAIYRIGWQNSFTREEDALLRRALADSRLEENDHFAQILLATTTGQRIHDTWQALVRDGVGRTGDDRKASHVWLTMEACDDYCRLIDEDWVRIADWYRPGSRPFRGTTAGSLYSDYVSRRQAEQGMQPDDEEAG